MGLRGKKKKGGKMSDAKLTTGKRILLALAFLADCLDEARLLGGLVGATYKQTYGWIPPQYKRQSFYSQVWRLINKGCVRKVGKGKNSVLEITPKGRVETISLSGALWPTEWDGFWTLVFFDIRETSRRIRDSLRVFLKRLKFGMFQRSVWAFPGNFVAKLRKLIKEEDLQNYVLVISSKDLGIKDQKALVERVWRVSSLNKKYKKLIEEIETAASLPREKKVAKTEKIKERLLVLLNEDPMLPLALLPDDWAGRKAVKMVLASEKEISRKSKGK